MAAPPPSKLDFGQILKASFDEENGRLRTDAAISGDLLVNDINILHGEDSIRLGDGTDLVTTTEDSGKVGLDVHLLNDVISVNVLNDAESGTLEIHYDEIMSVASGSPTIINSYTASSDCILKSISSAGQNIAEYEVLINSDVIEKKYTYFGSQLNVDFNYDNYRLLMGDTVLIRVTHNRPSPGNFNSSIKVVT